MVSHHPHYLAFSYTVVSKKTTVSLGHIASYKPTFAEKKGKLTQSTYTARKSIESTGSELLVLLQSLLHR